MGGQGSLFSQNALAASQNATPAKATKVLGRSKNAGVMWLD